MTNVSLHCFSRFPRRFLLSLGLGLGLLTVGAIAPPPSPSLDPTTPVLIPSFPRPFATLPPLLLESVSPFWQGALAQAPNTMTVTLFTPTETCETFQGEERAIASDKAISQIVHTLLTTQTPNLLDFELAGYRLRSDTNGNHVTIDFRRKPGAQRQFISLSMCEQLVLFGSLRKTLLENPTLHIDTVQFTEQGRPIEL